MNAVQISHITKDYGNSRGIFDVSLSVKKGEVYGFLGPNGAGKTTTIRHLLGFLKPEKGECRINGMDCFKPGLSCRGNCLSGRFHRPRASAFSCGYEGYPGQKPDEGADRPAGTGSFRQSTENVKRDETEAWNHKCFYGESGNSYSG